MIFVTVGASRFQFDRLMQAVGAFPAGEEIVVQCGPSAVRPERATCVDFMAQDALVEHIRRARVVVTHGGIGTIMVALANGKRPIVVPRQSRHGETVDDHQVESVRRLESAGLVVLVEDPSDLPAAIESDPARAGPAAGSPSRLTEDVGAYIRGVVEGRTRSAPPTNT